MYARGREAISNRVRSRSRDRVFCSSISNMNQLGLVRRMLCCCISKNRFAERSRCSVFSPKLLYSKSARKNECLVLVRIISSVQTLAETSWNGNSLPPVLLVPSTPLYRGKVVYTQVVCYRCHLKVYHQYEICSLYSSPVCQKSSRYIYQLPRLNCLLVKESVRSKPLPWITRVTRRGFISIL